MTKKLNVVKAANVVVKMPDPTKRGYAFRYLHHVVTNTYDTGTSFRNQRGWSRPPDLPDTLDGIQAATIRRAIISKLGIK